MVRIIVVANGKGGVGKTTTAAELVVGLWRQNRHVLAMDLDEQGNFTKRLGFDRDSRVNGEVWDVLTGEASWADIATPSPLMPNVDVALATTRLALIEDIPRDTVRNLLTSRRSELNAWEVVVVDLAPSLRGLAVAALAAADVVVGVCELARESADALERLEVVCAGLGKGITWVVPTMFDSRTLNSLEELAQLRERWGERVLRPVRHAVAAKDAFAAGMPVGIWDTRSTVAQDMQEVTRIVTSEDGK